jgi:hypothetical protein
MKVVRPFRTAGLPAICVALLLIPCALAGNARADGFPAGYSVDVDNSGTSTSGELGGSGRLEGSGGSFGEARECAPNSEPGPFSIGFFPPHNCEQVGRPYASPENTLLFTGNQNCVENGRPDSGTTFTWRVQLPHSGYWHVEIHVPNWTQYGEQDVYRSRSADGMAENTINDQANFGRWVTGAFGSHRYEEDIEYTVQLVPAHDFHCFYEPADQVRWVYDGPSSPSATISSPAGGGVYPQGALVRTSFFCTEAFAETIESCTDSNGATEGSGELNTSTPGEHAYTVIAKGTAGATGASSSLIYSVKPAKGSCTGDAGKLSLSPGVTAEPAVQSVKLKGTLSGCSGGGFTSAKYAATLRTTEAVDCEALSGPGVAAAGTISLTWEPKAKGARSVGSFDMVLTKSPDSELGGLLESGPFSPGNVYDAVSQTYTGEETCGVPVKSKVKPVKKGLLAGSRFVVY